LADRREAGVPHRLRVIAADGFHQVGEPLVGHHGQVSARVAGIDLRAALALEDRDAAAFEGQQIRGRQPGNPTADDDDVDGFVTLEFRVGRKCRRVDPERLSAGVQLHARNMSTIHAAFRHGAGSPVRPVKWRDL